MTVPISRTRRVESSTHIVEINLETPYIQWAITINRRTGRIAANNEVKEVLGTWRTLGNIEEKLAAIKHYLYEYSCGDLFQNVEESIKLLGKEIEKDKSHIFGMQ